MRRLNFLQNQVAQPLTPRNQIATQDTTPYSAPCFYTPYPGNDPKVRARHTLTVTRLVNKANYHSTENEDRALEDTSSLRP